MFDIDVLTILSNKDKYERFSQFIKKHLISPEGWVIFEDMGLWFQKHDDIDWPSFHTWFNIVQHSDQTSAQKALYDIIFNKLDGHVVNASLEASLVEALVDRDYANKIADTALAVAEGDTKHSMGDIVLLVEERDIELDKSADYEDFRVTTDLNKLLEITSSKSGYSWPISQLNEALGSLKKGDFIVIGARPDSGKTTFLAQCAGHMLEHMPEDKNLLWFNNEEGGAKVTQRVMQSILGWTESEMRTNPLDAIDKIKSTIKDPDRIKFYDQPSLDIRTIKDIIKNSDPGLIVFDQLRKVHGFAKDSTSDVHRQELIYNWGREIAKEFAPVLTVHQAGGAVGGEKWIPMEALYGSQTAIQGEADAIITIGRTYEPSEDKFRFFNIPKNKMSGTNPSVRNGKFILEIDPERARFISDDDFDT